jgi:hypothetical protein
MVDVDVIRLKGCRFTVKKLVLDGTTHVRL